MPSGFTTDGLPVGVELLGGAFADATLVKFAYGWEQATKPRRAPFSTPPLVKGAAPPPVAIEATIGTSPSAAIKFWYDKTTGALRFDAAAASLSAADRVLGLTLQRSDGEKPGPIVAHILAPNQVSGSGTLTMRGRDRDDLLAGTLYLHFYTRQVPLGAGRLRLVVP
jgi:hypothetical protein